VRAPKRDIRIHNFYVPAGGDEPNPEINPKFRHKLDFLAEMRDIPADPGKAQSAILVGDLNIAPLETDVWSHKQLLKVVSHTPIETETLEDMRKRAAGRI
jgi:exodeoxyribonuclease-3